MSRRFFVPLALALSLSVLDDEIVPWAYTRSARPAHRAPDLALVDQKGRLAFIYKAPGLVYFPKGLADFEATMKGVVFL